jgi:hypothetical protein
MWSLLPFKPDRLLLSRKEKLSFLQLLQKLSQEATAAIDAFLSRDFQLFDAQVGDTSCHIRAYKISFLARDVTFLNSLSDKYQEMKLYYSKVSQKVEEYQLKINMSSSRCKILDVRESVSSFLENNELMLFLSMDYQFLVTSYFLKKYCVYDQDGFPMSIDYDLVKSTFCVTTKLSQRIANYYQRILSQLSCDFIFSLLTDYSENENYADILKNLFLQDDRERSLLPCYEVFKILLLNMLSFSLPIMFSIHCFWPSGSSKIVFLFKRNPSTGAMELQTNVDLLKCSEVSVIFKTHVNLSDESSIFEYVQRLFQYSPLDLILKNAAIHPQYTGLAKTELNLNPYEHARFIFKNVKDRCKLINAMEQEFFHFKHEAERIGCSKNNNSLFAIRHVFCDVIKNEAANSRCYLIYNNRYINDELVSHLSSQPVAS